MAKNLKFVRNETRNPKRKANISTSPVVVAGGVIQAAAVKFLFTSGFGQATASIFRNGVLINMESISSSGVINFSNVKTGDVISVNGVCTGRASIAINRTTIPETPETFDSGIIIAGYLIT